jgi:aspartate-semialdehyde dehydrogenase
MTYQAASGAGANNMKELICQMTAIASAAGDLAANASTAALIVDKIVSETLTHTDFPIDNFSAPLAGSLIPWIDKAVGFGQTREEWKGYVESNKILGNKTPIPVDGLCVRVGAMRSHSQAFTIKLKKDVPIQDLEALIGNSNDWVKIIPNDKESSIRHLTPAVVNGTLDIPVGRIHKMQMGGEYLTAFTVGDQLLWGAAEPIRRMLNIILDYITD